MNRKRGRSLLRFEFTGSYGRPESECMMDNKDHLMIEVTQRLVSALRPEQIILFGSHAWGDPDEDSDIDLYVIVRESSVSPTQRAAQAYRALRGLRAPIDVLVKTRAEAERMRAVRASLDSE